MSCNDNVTPLLQSPGERIGTKLKVYYFARHAFAAFAVKGRASGPRGPQTLAFPAGLRVVDGTVQTTPWVSMSRPRGEKPWTRAFGLFHGSSYRSAKAVAGGFEPGFSRTMEPGKPSTEPQTEPSAGLTVTP